MPRTASRRGLPPGISRIDQTTTRTHGYFVRVGYRKTTKGWRPKASAFFGDASHGGKGSALRAAALHNGNRSGRSPSLRQSAAHACIGVAAGRMIVFIDVPDGG